LYGKSIKLNIEYINLNLKLTKWNYIIMIRNLLASFIIFAASTFSFANDIVDSLKVEGATSSNVVTDALSACADSDCITSVIKNAIDAGIDASSVMSIALAAGIPAEKIALDLLAAGVSEQNIFQAAIANNIDPSITGLATSAGFISTSNKSLPRSSVPSGTETSVSPSN
jgi:uncharacterized SAM-binding protein YcdF (DUF218 family)